jgi:chemotaxis protein histidine kinase CheA
VSDDLLNDPSLIQDFLVESEEILQRMDQEMVALEATPQDAELLNRIFRGLHTIKGTSGFLGFEPVVRLSHRAEDVLNALRKGEAQLNHPMIDALLGARDYLGKMLEDIRQGGLRQYEMGALLKDLEAAQSRQAPPALGELLVKQDVISAATLDAVLSSRHWQSPADWARCWWRKVWPLRWKLATRFSGKRKSRSPAPKLVSPAPRFPPCAWKPPNWTISSILSVSLCWSATACSNSAATWPQAELPCWN